MEFPARHQFRRAVPGLLAASLIALIWKVAPSGSAIVAIRPKGEAIGPSSTAPPCSSIRWIAAAEDSSAGAGISAASSFVTDAGAGVVVDPAVTGSRSGATATVTVTGAAQSLVPFLNPSVSQSASLPVERVTG